MDNGYSRFIGAKPDADDWRYETCEWTRYQYLCPQEHPGAGFACDTLLPSYVNIGCPSGYTPTVDNFCRLNPAREGQRCDCDKDGRINPGVGNPVLLSTGAKLLEALDYESADGLFRIGRHYRSFQVGRPIQGNVLPRALPRGLANGWNFDFNREIQLGVFSGSPSSPNATVAILLPDGTGYGFVLQSDGTWIEDPAAGAASASHNLKLEFVGTLPTDLSTVRSSASTWKLTDGDDTVWTLETRDSPNGGLYLFGWPTSMVTRSGYQQTFAYDSDSSLTSITDSFGRVATFEWNEYNITTLASPPAGSLPQPMDVKSITLPDGTTLKYSYDDAVASAIVYGSRGLTGGSKIGSSSGIGFVTPPPKRLSKVERRSATDDLLDSVTYLYENTQYPRNITGIVDNRDVRVASYTYDSAARVVETKGAEDAHSKTVAYGANGTARTRLVTNELGKDETYTYSLFSSGAADYRLTGIAGAASTNTAASTASTSYGSDTFISSQTDEEGRVTSTTRDSRGRPTAITEADGTADERTTTITWDSTFNVPDTIVRPGLTETRAYDTSGRLQTVTLEDTTSQSVPYSTNGQTRTTTYAWDSKGRLLSENGPLAAVGTDDDLTSYGYDTDGNLLTVTDALGHVTTYGDYDTNGRPGTMTDANGVVTDFAYDPVGRIETITVEHPTTPTLNAVTTIAYDEVGNVTELTLPSTDTLLMDYDDANRLVTVRAASGERRDYVYDKMGNVTSETVKRGNGSLATRTTSAFDELGRLIARAEGVSQPARSSYDKVDNVTGSTSPNGYQTTIAFDALDRVISTVAPDSGTTGLDYDPNDNLTAFTDPISVTTDYVYDGFGDVIQETSPDRGTSTYLYDEAGRVIEATDGRGQVIDYTRDFLGRVTETAPQGLSSEAVAYTWDTGGLTGSYGVGRLGKVEDASGTTQFQYDHRGNLLAKQQTIGSTSAAQLAYTYDTADRITQIAYPSGRLVQYTYDSKGRVSAVQTKAQASDPTWTLIANGFGYEAFGPLTAMTFGNGLAVAKSYGTDGLIASNRLYRTSDSTNLSDLAYRHDSDGNVGAIIDQLDDTNSVLFGYDGVGRMAMTVAAAPGTATSYSYTSGTNQLASLTDASGTRTIAYDDRGNTESETRPGSVTLSTAYDGYGRLASYARTDLGTATFVYNGLDDRVTMSLPTAGTRHFVYDAAGRVMGEYGASASDVQAEFIWLSPEVGAGGPFGGDDGLGGYAPLAVATPDASATIELNWIYADHLGTPLIETDATGALATTPDDYLAPAFPGQSRMFADLYYNRYRDYDPTTGRYIEADPIGLDGGDNPFVYVDDNPINAIDPLGLDAIEIRYDYYPVDTGLGFHLPLGHSGVVTINPKTGETRYYEFGRYVDKNCGNVEKRTIPDLRLLKDGGIDKNSLKDLYAFLSKRFGHNSHITPIYHPETDYNKANSYAENFKKTHSCYNLLSNSCKTFAHDAANVK